MSNVYTVLMSKVELPVTFNSLMTLINAVGIEYILSGPGPLTIFAPVDSAFEQLGRGETFNLLKNITKLTTLLQHHIVPLRLTVQDMMSFVSEPSNQEANQQGMLQLPTAMNQVLTVKFAENMLTVNGVRVIRPDLVADNGVIHIIEDILWPTGITMEDFGTRTPLNEGDLS